MRKQISAEQFDQLVGDIERIANNIISDKRPEYTVGNTNVVENFDKAATEYKLSIYTVPFLLLDKQISALKSDLLFGIKNSEPLESRFGDAINFLRILWVLYAREAYPSLFKSAEDRKDPRDISDVKVVIGRDTQGREKVLRIQREGQEAEQGISNSGGSDQAIAAD